MFGFKRLCVLMKTHLHFTSNVLVFYFERTYVLHQTYLRFFEWGNGVTKYLKISFFYNA